MFASLFSELMRRNVFRVAAMYVVVSWLLLQIGDVVFPALRLPDWSLTLLIALLALGLPVALVFAWAFELTPQGLLRTEDVPTSLSTTASTGQKINYLILIALSVAVAVLIVRIAMNEVGTPATQSASSTDRSIAVLPFSNQSADEENAEFFAGGLHDELLTLLSRLGQLRVISRTSVERLDPSLSIGEIGALLGVATVLEGQVRRAGNRIRINVQLTDTAAEGHVWANTYDSTLTAENVFNVQSEIARTIATSLRASLSPGDERALADLPTRNTEALENYLLAVQLDKRGTMDALTQARDYLIEATRLDPGYAEAWAQLADAYDSLFATGAISESEYRAAAKPAIDKAIELDPDLPAARAELAVFHWRSGDEDQARQAFAEARRLGSTDAALLHSHGVFLRRMGDLELARQVLLQAVTSNPLDTRLLYELGRVEMHLGHPEQLLVRAERIREISPSSVDGYAAASQATAWMGRFDLMWTWMMRALEVDPLDAEIWAHLAGVAEDLGESDWADRYLSGAEGLQPEQPVVLRTRVELQSNRGDFDAALAVARRALDAKLDDRWRSDEVFLRAIRNDALQTGQVEAALVYYRERVPGQFAATPVFEETDFVYADDVASLLRRAGAPDQAAVLLEAAIRRYEETQPEGVYGLFNGISYVHLLAVAGHREAALSELRRAVDSGWRWSWRWYLADDSLASLRDAPEYQEIVADLEADMATQLDAVRRLPDMGANDLRNSQ